MSEISNYPASSDLLLRHLRSITFNFDPGSQRSPVSIMVIKKILDATPNLSHLVISWDDFRHCSKTYSNLKHLRLILDGIYAEPEKYFSVRQLTQLAPHLCRLETTGANILLKQPLIKFILKIICGFHQLVELVINKNCLYQSKQQLKDMFKESLIAAVRNQLFDCDNIQIDFAVRNSLYVWR